MPHVAACCGLMLTTKPMVSAAPPCDPGNYCPNTPPSEGCDEWTYFGTNVSIVTKITVSADTLQNTSWEPLPFCACGWYPVTIPCPACPPITTEVSISDTLQWTVTTSLEQEYALDLKAELIVEVGFSGTLTLAEQQSLSGTHTEITTTTFSRQPILCFTRHYRQQWTQHVRGGERIRKWTYYWIDFCAKPEPVEVETTCEEILAQGIVTWNTYPNYQWAPQKPPCGGVAIQTPDPWGGKREEPCCENVCSPPPPPQLPCCGCSSQP